MTIMRDTEGEDLPGNSLDDKHDDCWYICLFGDGELSLSIPMRFETDSGEYVGAGVVTASIRDVVQEYLDDCEELDEGAGLMPLAKMFRDFAEKFEKKANEILKNE